MLSSESFKSKQIGLLNLCMFMDLNIDVSKDSIIYIIHCSSFVIMNCVNDSYVYCAHAWSINSMSEILVVK